MSDLISRQAAIDALMKRDKELRNINWYDNPYAEGECSGIDEALAIVSNLPSAQPENRTDKRTGTHVCDLISRQQAIDALSTPHGILYPIRTVEALPSVHPQRWIPCSERLPEESGSYFVSGKWASGKVAVGDCEYSKDDGYFQTAWNFDVIAWMPLPEPYKGERNEID